MIRNTVAEQLRNSWYSRLTVALALIGLLVVGALASLLPAKTAVAAIGINQQINFQGRLLDGSGAVVADGTYNMQFKIYEGGDGCMPGGSGASPCGGTNVWTETRQNSATQGVTVRNGYFSVALGSVNPFGSSVDWNEDTLWLSLNVGGTATGGSPTYDGEMLPFRRLSTTPYALNAMQLGGITAGGFIQNVSPAASQQTANINLLGNAGAGVAVAQLQQVASATAPVLVLKGGATPGSGADLLQLQNSGGTALARFTSAGDLAVASAVNRETNGTLSVGTTSTTTALSLGRTGVTTTNAGALTVAEALTGQAGLAVTGGTVDINVSSNNNTNINTGSSTGAITIGNSAAGAISLQSSADITLNGTGALNLQSADKIQIGTSNTTGTLLVLDDKTSANDPSGVNGGMYYNSNAGKFRCYQASIWQDCLGGSAAEYLRGEMTSNQSTDLTAGNHLKFDSVQASAGSSISLDTSTTYTSGSGASIGRFTLAAGKTYKLRGVVPQVNFSTDNLANLQYRWHDVTNGVALGSAGGIIPATWSTSNLNNGGYAEAVFTPSTNTLVEMRFTSSASVSTIFTTLAPSAIIEVLSDGSAIPQFQGATSSTDGILGYVPAPVAGQQGSVLLGNGNWSTASNLAFDPTATTGNGQLLVTNSLTSGTGLNVSSSATALTGDLAKLEVTGNNAGVTGSALKVGITGASATGTAANITNAGSGLTLRVNDDGTYSDSTPFVIDNDGKLGLGTATPTARMQVSSSATETLFKITDATSTALDVVTVADEGAATFRNRTNSAGAFQVQNAGSSTIMRVNTVDDNLITNPDFEAGATGWSAVGTSSTVTQSSAQSYQGSQSLAVHTGTATNSGARFALSPVVTSASTVYTVKFYTLKNSSDTNSFFDLMVRYSPDGSATADCTVSGMNSQSVDSSRWSYHTCQFSHATTPTTSGYLQIMRTGTSTHDFYIDEVSLEATSGTTTAVTGAGTLALNASITSPVVMRAAMNVQKALLVQNSAGTAVLEVSSELYDGGSVLSNGGFESHTTGWSATGTGATIARTTSSDTTYMGEGALLATLGTAANSGVRFSLNPVVTFAGSSYMVTFYAKRPVGSAAITDLTVIYSPDGTVAVNCSSTINTRTVEDDGWTRFYCEVDDGANTTPTTSGYLQISSDGTASNRSFYIDNVVMAEGMITPVEYRTGSIKLDAAITSPLFVDAGSSTHALLVMDRAGDDVFTVDTTYGQIRVGTVDTLATLFVLDTKTSAGDPTGTDGAMYYNASSNSFRCYQEGTWIDCIRTGKNSYYAIYEGNSTAGDADYHFLSGNGGSISYLFSGGTIGHPGILELTTGTSSVNGYTSVIARNQNAFVIGNGGIWKVESLVNFPNLSNSTHRYNYVSGLIDQPTIVSGTPVTDGCFIRYSDNVNGGEWQGECVEAGGGASTTCDTNVPVNSTSAWYRVGVVVNAAGTQADFYVDGVLRCSVAADIPTSSSQQTAMGAFIEKNGGTGTARTALVDYIEVWGQLDR